LDGVSRNFKSIEQRFGGCSELIYLSFCFLQILAPLALSRYSFLWFLNKYLFLNAAEYAVYLHGTQIEDSVAGIFSWQKFQVIISKSRSAGIGSAHQRYLLAEVKFDLVIIQLSR